MSSLSARNEIGVFSSGPFRYCGLEMSKVWNRRPSTAAGEPAVVGVVVGWEGSNAGSLITCKYHSLSLAGVVFYQHKKTTVPC